MAETLASQLPATAMVPLVRPAFGWVGNEVWCGWWLVWGTLLGPERTSGVEPLVGVVAGLLFLGQR